VIVLVGCSHNQHAQRATLVTDGEELRTVKVLSGSTVEVQLLGWESTGYSWYRKESAGEKTVVRFLGESYLASENGIYTGGETSVFSFVATKPGEVMLAFEYRHPNQKTPKRKFETKIVVERTD